MVDSLSLGRGEVYIFPVLRVGVIDGALRFVGCTNLENHPFCLVIVLPLEY